ncbi:MAG: sulfatase [Provencibacterium sp.]|nr:sulfatase [Provencibacterium sp.]
MKTIFLLMDSLNRHYLEAYGGQVKTPNLDRLIARSLRFDNHWCGSMPCMPARRELMTGRLNFLEAPWGAIEPWDDCLPVELRRQKRVYSHLITDHYHYFHGGGEGYHTLFDSWEFERGQEGDVWHPLVKEPEIPVFRGKNRRAYWVNRTFIDPEQDESYPTPRCFMRAMEFLENNHSADNWHLHLEVFDPHEPFVCPKKYRDLYQDDWKGPYHFDWPPYAAVTEGPEAVQHIRRSYAGVLSMADVWLGKLLDKMDELDMWKDTVLILTTDHGHLLGEHGYWAKNYMFDYRELAQLPLFICAPSVSPGRRQALTASMDIMPTLMQLHGARLPDGVHGRSLCHLLHQEESHHDAVLYGYFGKDINLFNGRYTYCRQPLNGSVVHRHTLMPTSTAGFIDREQLQRAEMGIFLRYCHDIPQLRIAVPSHRHADAPDFNPIYDLDSDPWQEHPLRSPGLEKNLEETMGRLLDRFDAPDCQYVRTGLRR